MKRRSDFVTNSSSSSFILGTKDDDTVTKDSVYSIIRNLYLEYIEKRNQIIQYIKEHPTLGIVYDEERGYLMQNNDFPFSKRRQIEDMLFKIFGIYIYNISYVNESWLSCTTYEEYEKFWIHKIKTEKKAGPFTIGDYANQNSIIWLHFVSDTMPEKLDVSIHSEELLWYYPELLDNPEKIIDDNACLQFLGKICVYSECGYIPSYVVERLSDLCSHSCNHMG